LTLYKQDEPSKRNLLTSASQRTSLLIWYDSRFAHCIRIRNFHHLMRWSLHHSNNTEHNLSI
jgi:3-phenylpropionate/cinnamic acid dioxygenase small subunit